MPPLFRRRTNIQCFFCNSALTFPPNPRNFRCPSCGCWNRYNEKGEILSDEPAMHEEQLNRLSFSKRGSPSKDQLPNPYRAGPFCHNCQTNQMLIINLLSNYLPSPDNPEYQQRVKMLPEYKESLHARYPPVCDSCRPAVEEEIERKDQMARRKALGGWLKEGKDRQRRVSATLELKEKIVVKTLYWRIRGVLWFISSLTSITALSLGIFGYSPLSNVPYLTTVLPVVVILSLLWAAWDPTYITVQKSYIQGRGLRIVGKRNYIISQMAAWSSRLLISIALLLNKRSSNLTASLNEWSIPAYLSLSLPLAIEFTALLAYPLFLRTQNPPPIRLIDTQSHKHLLSRSATPATSTSQSSTPATTSFPKLTEQDFLSSLSLSSKPVITPKNPVFGLPSLLGSTPAPEPSPVEDEDAMDWTPIGQESTSFKNNKRKSAQQDDDASWLRPQRFFAPEAPTGLENLFSQTRLDDDAMRVDQDPFESPLLKFLRRWRQQYLIVAGVFCCIIVVLACKLWLSRMRSNRPFNTDVVEL